MYVTIEQVKVGFTAFVEQEVAVKATGVQKFLSYCALPLVGKTVENYAKAGMEHPITAQFFNESGNVNIDELYNMAKSAVRKSGQFTVYGVILGETDIDKIYNNIMSAR